MENVINELMKLGWINDGRTRSETFRMGTHESPIYGGMGGKLVTTGGRLRLKRGEWLVTIGKRTTCFYPRQGVRGRMMSIPTKDIESILAAEKQLQTNTTAKKDKCPFDPSAPPYNSAPIGMFHCPECGEMVVAGITHPDYSQISASTAENK